MTSNWITLLLPVAILIALGWLLVLYCGPPLCWLLLSLMTATVLVLLVACGTSLASCVCGKWVG